MMGFADILLLSVALAMDCFAVSIACGVIVHRCLWGVIVRIAFFFGFFQAAMPLIGWVATNRFDHYIEAYDHWVAFGSLAFLGGRMIMESFDTSEIRHFNPQRLATQLLLSVATSIDALAIGISFAVTGYTTVASLFLPLVAIGAGSFMFSLLGHMLGIRFGASIRRRLRPELLGGIILLFIGLKILFTHLFVLP